LDQQVLSRLRFRLARRANEGFTREHTLTDVFIEVDYLAPIQSRIDVSHGAGFRTFQVRADIVPVPGRQAFEPEAAPMVEAFLIARRLRWSDTVDDDCLEARVAIGVGGGVKELLTAS